MFQWRSLKAKVTIFTMTFFLLGSLSLAFYASYSLYHDMEQALGEQQFSTVSIIAAEINTGLDDRMKALEKVAALITPAMMGNAVAMQSFIEGRTVLPLMFNGGFFVLLPDGTAIADYPLATGRRGVNFIDRKYAIGALKEGKTTIGNPVMGKALRSMLFSIAVPIHNAKGKVIGALAGTVDLAKPNFISRITDNTYGKTGGYLLVAPKVRTIVFATDKKRILEVLPVPGVSALIDRFIQGYEGSGISIRPSDKVETLSSAKGVPLAGWYVVALMPADEAFAPIRAMMWRIILSAIFLAILLGSLTLWMLKRQLTPVFTTIKTLATLSDTDHPLQPLPISRQDEIGELISSFNRLMETVAQRDQALQQSEGRFRQITENLQEAVWSADLSGKYDFLNPTMANIYGRPLSEMMANPALWIEAAHPADQATVRASQDALLRDRQVELEYRIVLPDGTERWIYDRKTVLLDMHGQPSKIAGIISNIADRKQAEAEKEKLEAQNRKLQKSESLGRMAAAIAHHFNNQLGVVIGNLEMAINEQPKGAAAAKSLTSAMDAAWKSADMSGLMLTYLGQSHNDREPLDLSYFCRKIMPLIKTTLPGNVVMETDFPLPRPIVMANTGEIQQIFTNLITNAREAIDNDKGTISLSVKTVSPIDIPTKNRFHVDWESLDKTFACLEVTDTGCGIEEKDIEKLFDPFYSTKFTGRGMGLAVVLGLANSHKGVITVDSKPGKGSTFRLFFPVSEEALRQPQTAENDSDIPVSAPSPGKFEEGGTMLLVEDEEALRKMIVIMLGRLGFSALEAKDGIEALEVFGKHQSEIKFVLTDLTMPRMDGWETLTELRKLQPDIPVILASGYDLAHVMAGDHSELPQAFLAKPYNLKALSDAISQAMERKKAEGKM